MTDDARVYEVFDLNSEIARLPPDPESAAMHRADTLVKSDTLRVVLITALKGATLKEHKAPGPITVHVIEGAFSLTIDGEFRELGVGGIAIIAPSVLHEVTCEADGAFLLTIAHLSHTPEQGGDN